VGKQQLEALAKALPALQDLNLSYNSGMRSFGELRALLQLSNLTRLDVSHPQQLQHPDADIPAVFELTQLHSLSASYVMPVLPQYSMYHRFDQPQPVQTPAAGAAGAAASAAAGDASAAAVGAKAGGDAAGTSTAAAAAAAAAAGLEGPQNTLPRHMLPNEFWQRLHLSLSLMQHLTELNFQGNLSTPWDEDAWMYAPPPPPPPRPPPDAAAPAAAAAAPVPAPAAAAPAAPSIQALGGYQAALLLHALASVHPQAPLRLLRLSLPHPREQPLHDVQAADSVHARLLQLVAGPLALCVLAAESFGNAASGKGSSGKKEASEAASEEAAAAAAAVSHDMQSNASSSGGSSSGLAPNLALSPAVQATPSQQQAWWRGRLVVQPAAASQGAPAGAKVQAFIKLTPEAAALIKQLLPSLQLLQLATKPFEHEGSGLGRVTWPEPETQG
jgi:hypothetical protein